MRQTFISRSIVSIVTSIFALGCAFDAAVDEERSEPVAEVSQDIAGGSVVASDPTIVAVQLAPDFSGSFKGPCTGILIARDAILTARHCVPSQTRKNPSPAAAVARISRKLGPSDWECVSNYNNVPTRGTTSTNACTTFGLANVYFLGGSGTGNDLALLRPIKSSGTRWIPEVYRHVAVYADSLVHALQQFSWGVGANSNNGSGGGELRGGIFNLYPVGLFGSYYEFLQNQGYRPCAGDSGAPMGVLLFDSPYRFAVAGLISGGETEDSSDACGTSSGVSWAVCLAPSLGWIETSLGRACARETGAGAS